jgi:hypothetical protein
MKAANQKRIREMLLEIFGPLSKARGYKNYEDAVNVFREEFRDKGTSPAAWLHKQAKEAYPLCHSNSIQPEQFGDILGMVDNIDTLVSATDAMSDDDFPAIEAALHWMLREFLPSKRAEGASMKKHLPQYRRGPGKRKMPSDAECLKIYNEFLHEYAENGSVGEAQRNVARKRKLNPWMIQRIRARYKRSSKSESDGTAI